MSNLKPAFIDHLLDAHPVLRERPRAFFEERVAEGLLSPFEIRLPKTTLDRLHQVAAAFGELREKLKSSSAHLERMKALGYTDPGNRSIMMSYDLHVDEAGGLKLIEVNTNAAFLIMGAEMYALRGVAAPVPYSAQDLGKDVLEELSLWAERFDRKIRGSVPRVAIVDDKPEEQRLFIEFVVAEAWFKSFGWNVEIRDANEAMKDPAPDFIYNRSTDFLFETSTGSPLRHAFRTGAACISPNPHEYVLMADKTRLVEWSKPGALAALGLSDTSAETILSVLPECLDLSTTTVDEMWARRKSLFFKPKREFGSKRAFKGASISRKIFDELMANDPLAQEYVPAPERIFNTDSGPQSFKFDLRCHAYADRLEGVIARVYQGQVTNLRTPNGGFAPVVFE